MNKPIIKLIYGVIISGFLMSCEKAVIVPSDAIIAQDMALSQKYSNMFQDIVNQVIESQNISTLKTSEGSIISAAKIEVEVINSDKTIFTVHFDGTPIGVSKVEILGDMIIEVNGKKLNEDGMNAIVSTKNLVINGIHVQDDLKVSVLNIATTGSYEETWNFTQSFTLRYNDGSNIHVEGNGKRFQTAGFSTESFADDSYKIDMTMQGTATNAVEFSGRTSAPLVKLAGCKYFAGGTFNWTSTNGNRFVDFGNGSVCDALAIVNVNGKEVRANQQ